VSAPVVLFESAELSVLDSRCRRPRSGPGPERDGEPSHLALFSRGGFRYHLGRRSYLGDPCTALLHRAGTEYRIGHPGEDGDDATLVVLGPALHEELFGQGDGRSPELPLAPKAQLLHVRLQVALGQGRADPLACQERTLELLHAVAGDRARRLRSVRGPAQRRAVSRAREMLGSHLERNLGLDTLATAAGCSAFHLMRLFRAETGRTLRAYRRELRVLAALRRLARGERDLAGLAVELGFCHHSHLTESFRRVLGISPRALRAELLDGRAGS
jgi:AraC-like DNA-binding protein